MENAFKKVKVVLSSWYGFGGAVLAVWKPLEWLVGRVGDMEIVVNYWPSVTSFLDTGTATVVSTFAGLGLIAYAIWNTGLAKEPSLVSSDVNQPDKGRRISLLDFKLEAKNAGWDVYGKENLEVMDLLDGLRQALVDGLGAFGRPMRFNVARLIKNEPISVIDPNHWKDYEIECGNFADRATIDNFEITSSNVQIMQNQDRSRYCDIWLNREDALLWLKTTAQQFKGRRDDFNAKSKKWG